MTTYYNEFDPKAAAWLRELIKQGLIAPGYVDERSIEDVSPSDLEGFTQCHFFAGIGGWSYALRLAGWPDDKPVWTGSCPCQSFSVAGKGAGFADKRHLWPSWFWLISQCRPDVIFGEQVEAAVNHGWLDLVCSDLEGEGYAAGAIGLPACGVGTPHIRQRLWFVADTDSAGRRELRRPESVSEEQLTPERNGNTGGLANTNSERRTGVNALLLGQEPGRNEQDSLQIAGSSEAGGLAESETAERGELRNTKEPCSHAQTGRSGGNSRTDAPASVWANPDWLGCKDGKWRPVESGTFPLADGISGRVGLLRGYGNAIVPQVAAEIIKAYVGRLDIVNEDDSWML